VAVVYYRVLYVAWCHAGAAAPGSRRDPMKKGIHPNYKQATVTCACGETFVTGSTRENIRVEICSKCHPFYTGQRKFVDSEGRVQKFAKKYGIQI
jgi:large subunit ribosomal protein L31